jgi:hypothetical protein
MSNSSDPGAESRAKLDAWAQSGRVLCAMVSYGSPWFRFSYLGRLTKQGDGTFYIFVPVEPSTSGFIGFDFNTVEMEVHPSNLPAPGGVTIRPNRANVLAQNSGLHDMHVDIGESRPY